MQGPVESWEAPGGARGVGMAGVREEVSLLASRIEDQTAPSPGDREVVAGGGWGATEGGGAMPGLPWLSPSSGGHVSPHLVSPFPPPQVFLRGSTTCRQEWPCPWSPTWSS